MVGKASKLKYIIPFLFLIILACDCEDSWLCMGENVYALRTQRALTRAASARATQPPPEASQVPACLPDMQVDSSGNITIAGIECPRNGLVAINFDSGGGGNVGFSAIVNGEAFTCSPSSKANIFSCSGPEQKAGSTANITVCGGSTAPGADCCMADEDFSILFKRCMLINQDNLRHDSSNCQPGYDWVEGQCLLIGRGMCASFSTNVPACIGGCDVGLTMVNGQCVKQSASTSCSCSSYQDPASCKTACSYSCEWNYNDSTCVPKG